MAARVVQEFKEFDQSGSGKIPQNVLKNIFGALDFPQADLERLLQIGGFGSSGEIDYAKFVAWLDAAASRPLNLILFGAPGSGKGTQCEKLRDAFGLRHISTGDVLRDHVKRETVLGKRAKEFMNEGKLVPDELMIDLIKEETNGATSGWLIDGMPRTRPQAEAMTSMGLVPQAFITLNVPDEVLEERITQRRLDPETGDIYHLKFKPPTDPKVEARLTQRADDTAEKLRTRLSGYHANLSAVKSLYQEKGTLAEIDGVSGGINGVYCALLTSLLKTLLTSKSSPTPMNLILFGAPGSGKGTQCEKLRDTFGLRHISTGDVLRDHVKRETVLGKRAKEFMNEGKLVPDELMIDLIKEETNGATSGWLIDGMPRTRPQAEAMSTMGLAPQAFISLNVPDEVLEERITQRRLDPETGDIYHLKFKPPTDPKVEARLTQRADDTAEKLRTRLSAYHENLATVKGLYSQKGSLVELDGATGGIDGVSSALLAALVKVQLRS